MKTRNLLIFGAVALTAAALDATAADALLTPRAAGIQIKHVSGTNNDPNLVAMTAATVSPRTMSNKIKTVAGTNSDINLVAACAANMTCSPRQIQACVEHPATMPGYSAPTVAPLK